jgi:hypothetical protein
MDTSPSDRGLSAPCEGAGGPAATAGDRGTCPVRLAGGMGTGALQFALASTLAHSPLSTAVSGAGLRHQARRTRLHSFLRSLAATFV